MVGWNRPRHLPSPSEQLPSGTAREGVGGHPAVGAFPREGWRRREGLRQQQVGGSRSHLRGRHLASAPSFPSWWGRQQLSKSAWRCPGFRTVSPPSQKPSVPGKLGVAGHLTPRGAGTRPFGLVAQRCHPQTESPQPHPSFIKGPGGKGRGSAEGLRKAGRTLCLRGVTLGKA